MRLFEMKTVPKKAGLAIIKFGRKDGVHKTLPFRENTDIVLPDDPELEFFPLMNGEQFLLHLVNGEDWFGGTDERPFLVRLDEEPFQAFREEGENSFYAALKPKVITEFERTFQVASKRQGDIFAVPIPFTWNEIQAASLLCLGTKQEPQSVKSQPMFETRHKLDGLYGEKILMFGKFFSFVEGVLEAPDHSSLTLSGIHMIAQAQNLYNPRLAD